MSYVCHSGGALGADIEWEMQGESYGVKTIAYSFKGHNHKSKNPKVLTAAELAEGFQAVTRANKVLKRNINYINPYIRALISRDWFQVKNAEAVFAIAKKFLTKETVAGGTGWAVQMAIDCDKPCFVFYQDVMDGGWFRYMPDVGFESLHGEVPKLTKDFAGVGTRDLNDYGRAAIKAAYGTISV